MPATFDLGKIQKLVATATTPKQKQMYQGLLDKALEQQEAQKPCPPEPKPQKPASQPPEAKEEAREEQKTQKKKRKRRRRKRAKRLGPDQDFMFQAIGVISGDVRFEDERKATITIGAQTYPLLYSPFRRKVFEDLYKELGSNTLSRQRLAVYPKAIHYPLSDPNPSWCFSLVAFERQQESKGVLAYLKDFEFKVSGLWQIISACQTPVISVYKNYDDRRGKIMKESEPTFKVKLAKALHLPLIWPAPPVKPFRYNPTATEENREFAKFVQIKARFSLEHDCLEFTELLAPIGDRVPTHLRVSRKDKATAGVVYPD